MSEQHTPGPWEIDFGYNRIIKSIGPCFPDKYAGSAWLEVTEEDARLIAAAPELLAALQAGPSTEHALPFGNVCSCSQCEFVRLRRAAIAKAIG